MKVSFELTGISPLLFHLDDVLAGDALKEWRKHPGNKAKSVKGDDRSPPWTWMTYLPRDKSHVAMPTDYVAASLREAGKQVVLRGNKTCKELSQSGIWIDAQHFPFFYTHQGTGKEVQLAVKDLDKFRDGTFPEHLDAVKKLGFRLHVARARVGQSKHIRVRPCFDEWRVRGELTIVSSDLTFEMLKQIFEIAARGGYGDWRPNGRTPGPWGMAEVTLKRVGLPSNGRPRNRIRKATAKA